MLRFNYIVILVLAFFCSCSIEYEKELNVVRVRIDEFPDSYNPVMAKTQEAGAILDRVYEVPERLSDESNDVISWVTNLIDVRDSADLKIYRFRIKNEARWDAERKISTDDVLTTLKIMFLPGIDNQWVRLQYSFLKDVHVSGESQFEVVAVGSRENLRPRIGQIYILPKFLYDPSGYLDNVTLAELLNNYSELENHPDVIRFIEYFNSEQLRNEIKYGGSGPYKIADWNTGVSITLAKDTTWWGNELTAKELHFNHYPAGIEYHVIQDGSVALVALKNKKIDVLTEVSPADFLSMMRDKTYQDDFHFLSPTSYQFVYLGFNTRLSKLNTELREALSTLVPYTQLINIAANGFGQRTVGPMNPVDSIYYNYELELDQYNPRLSEQVLLDNGYHKMDNMWYDENNKVVTLTLTYQSGSAIIENIALILKDELGKFGIEIGLESIERSLLFKKGKAHDFEIMLSSFRGGPLAHNFAPLFSTTASQPGGLNFTGFGSQESDSVINLINYAEKKEEKVSGLKELQSLLHSEKTMFFLFFEKDRIIVSKKFTNVYGFSRKPGYNVTKFQLANPN